MKMKSAAVSVPAYVIWRLYGGMGEVKGVAIRKERVSSRSRERERESEI